MWARDIYTFPAKYGYFVFTFPENVGVTERTGGDATNATKKKT
jgi:hypothetical protein